MTLSFKHVFIFLELIQHRLTFVSSWLHRVVGRCRKCMKLDNDARLRHDISQYRAMLKDLRRSEERFEDGSKIAYLLQVGKHADSVICKMFWYKRDRDN